MLPPAFARYRPLIEQELRQVLAPADLPYRAQIYYHLGWADAQGQPQPGLAGKALRPVLCLLACQAVGGQVEPALPAAAALELIHNFSLAHDDIQDGDTHRRHRPTLWYLWGQPQALFAGNALSLLAGRALGRLEERGISPKKQLEVSALLDHARLEMIEGQYLDISYEGCLDITPQAYLEMVNKKTAALFGCAFQMGALLGDGESLAPAFGALGRRLGLAFQIRDDILGIWGQEEATGKPLASDIRRRKKSYPVVLALEMAREEIASLFSGGPLNEEEVAQALKVLEGLGVREKAQGKAQALKEAALVSLSLPAPWLQEFREMADFLVERDF